jgi:hypothetical protein
MFQVAIFIALQPLSIFEFMVNVCRSNADRNRIRAMEKCLGYLRVLQKVC